MLINGSRAELFDKAGRGDRTDIEVEAAVCEAAG